MRGKKNMIEMDGMRDRERKNTRDPHENNNRKKQKTKSANNNNTQKKE
jgi:hypothetical protein